MAFPNTLDNFTNPNASDPRNNPSHATQHSQANDAIEAIESNIGTNSGTSVLKNFAAGDFATRINGSNVLQQAISGTINNSVLGTPAVTGGTVNNAVLGTPTFTLGSDAQGDIFYRSSGGTVTRLAPGTSGQFLRTAGAAANPSWSNLPSSNSSFGVYLTGAATAPAAGTLKLVPFDTEEFDTGSEFGTSRFTAGTAGIYAFGFGYGIQMADAKQAYAAIYLNGTAQKLIYTNSSGATNQSAYVGALLSMAAADYVEFYVAQFDASARVIQPGKSATFAWGYRVS